MRPLRIFVAMPGSSMGHEPRWDDIDEIKRSLLEPVAAEIGRHVGRDADLVIEKDKKTVGPIYRSMYSEATAADVYVADLTAANPNVYLELGVRWALRDGVTIPIAQDVNDVRFNVAATRVIPYGPMPQELERAKEQIVQAAILGLSESEALDSPVRESLDLLSIPRTELADLHDELQRLKDERAEDLVAAAHVEPSPTRRMELLRSALDRNPANVAARIELGRELRKAGENALAAEELRRATRQAPDAADAWRELGVALSKGGDLELAVEALHEAVRLQNDDAEAWSNLGGALRRLARFPSGGFDHARLKEAAEAYRRAASLSGNDIYPLMNEARIMLALAGDDPSARERARGRFASLVHLARFAVESTDRRDAWKLMDLADALLLSGEEDEAISAARDAVAVIPPENADSYFSSAAEPLRDLLFEPGFDDDLVPGVHRLLAEYERARPGA